MTRPGPDVAGGSDGHGGSGVGAGGGDAGQAYRDAVVALGALSLQSAEALAATRDQPAAQEAARTVRDGDQALAEGRDRVVAAIQASQAALAEMGVTSLPPGGPQAAAGSAGGDPVDAGDALRKLTATARQATSLSAEQRHAAAEYRRLTTESGRAAERERQEAAARVRAEQEARQRAERIAREQAERERREAVEAAARARRLAEQKKARQALEALRRQRDQAADGMWRPGKKTTLAALDARVSEAQERLRRLGG